MSTPAKTPLTTAQKYAKINLTAEQRREAHLRAMEILRECASGTPEWEPVCEPEPLPEPIAWRLSELVALYDETPAVLPADQPASEVPQKAEDIVQVYQPVEQLKKTPFYPSLKTPITWGGKSDSW
jgi:hypothetical protein